MAIRTRLAIFGLILVLTGSLHAQGPKPQADGVIIELTELLPAELGAGGTLPEGWDEARVTRADGLYLGKERLTVREFVDALKEKKTKVGKLTIKVAPSIPLKRLLLVAQQANMSGVGLQSIHWQLAASSSPLHDLTFVYSTVQSMRIEGGRIIIEGGEIDLGGEINDALKESFEKQRAKEKSYVRLRLSRDSIKTPNATMWTLAGKRLKDEKLEERQKKLEEAIKAKIKKNGKATLALSPSHDLTCREIDTFYQLGQKYGAEATVIANPPSAGGGSFFSWFSQSGEWLPRAIDNSLLALSKRQKPDGSWATEHRGDFSSVGTTALTCLAYMGEFHTPEDGKYKETVKKALAYLKGKQRADGLVVTEGSGFSFDHVLATYALVEAYSMTGDEAFEQSANSAFKYLMRARNKIGVWGKRAADPKPDFVVSAWGAVIIKAADDAGLDIPDGATQKLLGWLKTVSDKKTGAVTARRDGQRITTLRGLADEFFGRHAESLNAVGLVLRARCGQTEEDERVVASVQRMILAPPSAESGVGQPDLDYLFFGSLAMNAYGGAHWQEWRKALDSAVDGYLRQLGGSRGALSKRMMKVDPVELSLFTLCLELSYRFTETYKDD